MENVDGYGCRWYPFPLIATVMIKVRITQPTEGIAFENPTYNFSVKENEPNETRVGEVKAVTGSQLIKANYDLMSHTGVFSVDETGVIRTLKPLDKEEKEMYILNVEATDSKIPPNIAKTTVLTHINKRPNNMQ